MTEDPTTAELVPDRSCGGCTACCEHLTINTPELRKPAGVLCQHGIPGTGCALYPNWPPICRTWFCGWRRFAWLDESWRPDRSGLLVMLENDVPAGYAHPICLTFNIFGPAQALLRPEVSTVIGSAIGQGIATFLSVPGPPAHVAKRTLLNPVLAHAVAQRNGDAIGRTLIDIFIDASLEARAPISL